MSGAADLDELVAGVSELDWKAVAHRPPTTTQWVRTPISTGVESVDCMSVVHRVEAVTDALADGWGCVISIGTTATAESGDWDVVNRPRLPRARRPLVPAPRRASAR